jgi:hypothetical protein
MGTAIPRITKLFVIPTLAVLFSFNESASAIERTLSWVYDDCNYSLGFDPGKYYEATLKNTLHLLFGPPEFKAPLDRLKLDDAGPKIRSALKNCFKF